MTTDQPPTPLPAGKYATTEEVANLCRTSVRTVQWWRYTGKGPRAVKVGRRVLYDVDALLEWIDAADSGGAA